MSRGVRIYLAVGLLTAAAIWCYAHFEFVTERAHVGYRGAAARNPTLALERLLARLGLEVREARDLAAVERAPAGATLILPRGRAAYTRARAEHLAVWVAEGGHVIVEAELLRERDVILDALGIVRSESPAAGGKNVAKGGKGEGRDVRAGRRDKPAEIRLPRSPPLRVAMPRAVYLNPKAPARAAFIQRDDLGTTVLHLEHGRGRVTVLPSLGFATNSAIGQHDHAAFAWALIKLDPAAKIVVVAARLEHPSLIAWVLREARLPLAAGAVLLVVWLWRAGTRFGPVTPEPASARRRLLEHLRASGRYLWRSGGSARLIEAARESSGQRIARAQPVLAGLPMGSRVPRIAELTHIPQRDVAHALGGAVQTPAQFTAAVRTLQRIEEQLTRSPGGRAAKGRHGHSV